MAPTPLANAKVAVGDSATTTDGQGHYSLTVPPGTYDVTASKFGYTSKAVTGVALADGQTVTENFALAAKPRVNVTGQVRDGSGHGWPLYATVRVKDEPTAVTYTDPKTGRYTLSLPAGDTYTLQTDPLYPGYLQDSADVQVGSADVAHDVNAVGRPDDVQRGRLRVRRHGPDVRRHHRPRRLDRRRRRRQRPDLGVQRSRQTRQPHRRLRRLRDHRQ